MTDLNKLLDMNPAPTVRKDLSARILAAAETVKPANDTSSRRPWWSIGGLAAVAAMAAIFFVQPASSDLSSDASAHWEQVADNSGFSELYYWVEGEDTATIDLSE